MLPRFNRRSATKWVWRDCEPWVETHGYRRAVAPRPEQPLGRHTGKRNHSLARGAGWSEENNHSQRVSQGVVPVVAPPEVRKRTLRNAVPRPVPKGL